MSQSAALLERRHNSVIKGVPTASPIVAAKAKNAEVWDVDGKRYIDLAMGIAVCNTGHCHPEVIEAVKAQAEDYTHVCSQVMHYEPYISLAERINDAAPVEDARTLFVSTGAEAVENAVRLARIATGRTGVIAFNGAFHGRTAMAVALTGKMVPYKHKLGPLVGGVHHAPFPIPHHGISLEESIRGLNTILKVDIEPEDVAAIVIEPVQGEGGFYQTPPELMAEIRRICDEHGIVMIADEIQTGFGRTGKMFAMEHFDVKADIITMAKGIAGGMPLAGIVATNKFADIPVAGSFGGTFGGNPLSCAAGNKVLDVIARDNLCERANEIGARIKERLTKIRDRNDVAPIGDIRGLGAMCAFELVQSKGEHTPRPEAIAPLIEKVRELGVIILSCGFFGNSIRLLPPLTIPMEQLDEALDCIEQALTEIAD